MAPMLLTLLTLSLLGPSSFPSLASGQVTAPAAGIDLQTAANTANAVVKAVTAGVSKVTGKKWSKPKVSDQGAAFCSNLVQSLNYCPRVPPLINLNLDQFSVRPSAPWSLPPPPPPSHAFPLSRTTAACLHPHNPLRPLLPWSAARIKLRWRCPGDRGADEKEDKKQCTSTLRVLSLRRSTRQGDRPVHCASPRIALLSNSMGLGSSILRCRVPGRLETPSAQTVEQS